tara:strand:+ start:1249 stop:1689 length:441 start_codon:yes stop_codon:yes gene_type:complete
MKLAQDLSLEDLQEISIQHGIYDRLIEERLERKPHQLICAICKTEFSWQKALGTMIPLCQCEESEPITNFTSLDLAIEDLERETFIKYMFAFYDSENGLYPIEGLTRERIIQATDEYKRNYDTWADGDSVDRERVRDIILGREFQI